MNQAIYKSIENHMLSLMNDSAHDSDHIYRVLNYALDIGQSEDIDMDVLLAAALLHDIGRDAQFEDKNLCHAEVGADMAYDFLISLGWSKDQADHVKACIYTHRYRSDRPPVSLEAKILFDADKLDVTGAVGIARTISYKGEVEEPLYTLDVKGQVEAGDDESHGPSLLREYHYKLKHIYNRFYTKRASEIAKDRERTAAIFCQAMFEEVSGLYEKGQNILNNFIDD